MNPKIIVVGSLNTDIVVSGIDSFPRPGQQVYMKDFSISAGGKSCNIAQMIATLTSKDVVAMLGKTIKDELGFYKFPLMALKKAGVSTEGVRILSRHISVKFPGIAVIPVDKKGNNTLYILPGANNLFSEKDIDESISLLNQAKYMVATLESPIKTISYAIGLANKKELQVFLDPGGIANIKNPKSILKDKIYFLKPNEHEAEILTGVKVTDFDSAKKASKKLMEYSVENVLITHGSNGAYFFNNNNSFHIEIPKVRKTDTMDETGCGDQTLASIVASLSQGKGILESVREGILAGTLQFYKEGIRPVTKKELMGGKLI